VKLKLLRDAIDTDSHLDEGDRLINLDEPPSTPPETISEYLLVCEASSSSLTDGHWRFSLESADGDAVMEAEDHEIGDLNRLTLLAAIRGLEAIEGPAAVTLLSNNRYLIRSLSDALPRWRVNGFAWEHFGRRVDVQHADLWRRIDRALSIHRVEACLVSSRLVSRGNLAGPDEGAITRVDAPHAGVASPATQGRRRPAAADVHPKDRLRHWLLAGTGESKPDVPQRRFNSRDLLDACAS
tara:strand:+ start:96609 stop:97328 length:720 start_codon:yes stop_codon:yes gene_type:complete